MNMKEVAIRKLNEMVLNFLENPQNPAATKNNQWKKPKQTINNNKKHKTGKIIPIHVKLTI